MANKRMFSSDIVDSDAFLDMPASSQVLYFHLGIRADDDGFVSNPKRIMRSVGANDDDIKLLIVKKFLLSFEDGVVVIKHWRTNNFIRKDIYKETQYLQHKSTLLIRKNGAYTFTDDGQAVRVPIGHYQVEKLFVDDTLTLREPSIVKDSIDKVSKGKISTVKKTYGEFENVRLTEKEYQKLVDLLDENAVSVLIAELDGYIASTGKRYKSHYATIQNWARRRIQDHKSKLKAPNVFKV